MTNASSGSGASFSLGASAVAEWTQATLNIDGKMIDVTSINSQNFKEYIAGKVGGNIALEGNFYAGDANGQLAMLNAAIGRTLLTGGTQPKLRTVAGGPNIYGDAYIENFKLGVPHDDKQTFSCTVRFTGAIAYAAS